VSKFLSNKTRVLGYVMARNEWPLLGIAIIHALNKGVARVVVVDHDSNDATDEGLRALESALPEQIFVYRTGDSPYFQEATTALVMTLVDADSFDWVYVFDADEFLLTQSGVTIDDVLADVPDHVDAIRYQLDNWISPRDFDDLEASNYLQIQHRAIPSQFLNLYPETSADEISHGNLNFFDLKLPSKLIVRGCLAHFLGAGAHLMRSLDKPTEIEIDELDLRAAHLALLSKRRLILKCKQGEELIRLGFPASHGWQSQMLWNLQNTNRLDRFWINHSIQDDSCGENTDQVPVAIIDDCLINELSVAVAKFNEMHTHPNQDLQKISSQESELGSIWTAAVTSIHRKLVDQDALRATLDSQLSGRQLEREELNREVVRVNNELRTAREGLIQVRAERDNVTGELIQVRAERDNVTGELIQVRAERDSYLESRSVKIGFMVTWPLRRLKSVVRQLLK
jgi:hypothetical protein